MYMYSTATKQSILAAECQSINCNQPTNWPWSMKVKQEQLIDWVLGIENKTTVIKRGQLRSTRVDDVQAG